MDVGHRPPPFGPTTSVVEAFLVQLRHVPQQFPHVALHHDGHVSPARRRSVAVLAEPSQRHASVQAAQQAVTDILQDLTWPVEAGAVRRYVEEVAPQVAAVLVLQGYVSPGALAEDYDRIYVDSWQQVFGQL